MKQHLKALGVVDTGTLSEIDLMIENHMEGLKIKKKSVVVLVIILMVSNIASMILIRNLKYNNQKAVEQLQFNVIQSSMVKLEGAIKYEETHNWKDDSYVMDKLDYVMEGIKATLITDDSIHALTRQQKNIITSLNKHLKTFDKGSDIPNITLSDNQHNELSNLGIKLRDAGFRMGMSYSSDWDSFNSSINKILQYNNQ